MTAIFDSYNWGSTVSAASGTEVDSAAPIASVDFEAELKKITGQTRKGLYHYIGVNNDAMALSSIMRKASEMKL